MGTSGSFGGSKTWSDVVAGAGDAGMLSQGLHQILEGAVYLFRHRPIITQKHQTSESSAVISRV